MATLTEGPHDDVEVERTTFTGTDGVSIPAIHARPSGVPVGGLVLHPDVMGIRALFDDLARRLATHGFAVIAPEPFARLLAGRVDLDDPSARMDHMKDLDDSERLADLERAADRLVVDDDVGEVAILGFCMGGMYTLKAAATGRFDRAVSFYGMITVPEAWRSPHQRDALSTAADVCATLVLVGGADPWIPAADLEQLRAAWRDRPDCEIVVYPGADHGFVHDPARPAHRDADAADAWSRALTFLGVG